MSDLDLLRNDALTAGPLRGLGITRGEAGPTLRIWSGAATGVDLVIDDAPTERVVPMNRESAGVWSASDPRLTPGRRYWLRADGEPVSATNVRTPFDPTVDLLDPYARGLGRTGRGGWRSVVVDESFDWGGVEKPRTPLDHTVVYEAHVRGFTRLSPRVPEDLRGTYAGLAHENTIAYLTELGVTAVQLLPVHQHVDEERLVAQGFENYWGYNTLSYFAPHAAYASRDAQLAGPSAILREFKGMVRLLHAAGIEVWLDVVFNHTAEEGDDGGPVFHLRGLDGSYYRHDADGLPIDVTGCGNTLDTSRPAAQRLVLDSLRYWANDLQIDGFRFDLAATLGRGPDAVFSPDDPLLLAIRDDPALEGVKLIAEPWDVGLGGWQTGNFPVGWSEWNDRFRNRARDFWLRDVADARGAAGVASNGLGSFASKLSGSSNIYTHERGPLAGVNFITAHDGFTLADLVSYDRKHNLRNGEDNRDGTDDNRSFNHGAEGPTDNPWILDARRRASRNLLATLFLSAGIPMLTAGDEIGRTQRGNNNGYCSNDEISWVDWHLDDEKEALLADTKALIRHRRENPALRPVRFGTTGRVTLSATDMSWFGADGEPMEPDAWDDAHRRTLQYLAVSTPELEVLNRVLVVVHGSESAATVRLPRHTGVTSYEVLWTSGDAFDPTPRAPGDPYDVMGPTVTLWRVS